MAATIRIPNSTGITNARGFLADFDWSLDSGETVIRFHEKWSHLQPWVLAAIAAWGLEAKARGVKVSIENGGTAGYAWRFGLADYLGVEPDLKLIEHEAEVASSHSEQSRPTRSTAPSWPMLYRSCTSRMNRSKLARSITC